MNHYRGLVGVLHTAASINSVCKLRLSQTFGMSKFSVLRAELYPVVHDRQRKCFSIRLEDGGRVDSAVLKYIYLNERHVHLVSTVVPEEFRGKGLASHLAKAALDFVVEEQLKATISCWYIKKYVEENPSPGYRKYIED